MRCPKCHYLSFEPEPRCRNCGFGLSPDDGDLLIKDQTPPGDALGELDLRPTAARRTAGDEVAGPAPVVPPPSPVRTVADAEHGRDGRAPSVVATRPSHGRVSHAPTSELPLFVKGFSTVEPETPAAAEPVNPGERPTAVTDAEVAADGPLVTVPAEPRAPLGVRRKVSEPAAARPARHTPAAHARKLGPLDRDLLEDLQRIEKLAHSDAGAVSAGAAPADRVGAGKRAAAAALDAVMMGGLAAAVLSITLRWCDIPCARATVLPIAPTAAFLLLVGAGYLLMFTAAGGQTLGKMAFGIRVVGDESSAGDLTIKQAVYRSLLTLPSVLTLGAGFLPALFGDERAIHDRLAHTRVVRA